MRSVSRFLLAATAVAALGACNSDSSVTPLSPPATLGSALGELSLSSVMPASLGTFPSVSPSPSSCAYDAASQKFTCATVNVGGYTVASSFTLLNAAGAAQSAFDQATTAAVRSTQTVTGSQVVSGTTTSMDIAQTLTLSGLLTGTHTLNGTQQAKVTTTPAGGSASTITVNTTIKDLVLPAESGPGHFPSSGSIAQDISYPAQSGLPAGTLSTLIVFSGSSKVDVTVTMGSLSQHCVVDLASSSPSCG